MEITKKRDIYQIVAAAGFLFFAVYRFFSMFTSDWYYDPVYSWYKFNVKLVICIFAFLGILILFCTDRFLLNFSWLLCVSFTDVLVLGLHEPLAVFRFLLYFFIAIVIVLNARIFRSKFSTVVTRFSWLFLCLSFGFVIIYMFIHKKGLNNQQLVFYTVVVFMLLYTMTLMLIPLKIFTPFVSKLFFIPLLGAVYFLYLNAQVTVVVWKTVRLLSMVPILNLGFSCSIFCLYLAFISSHKKELKSSFTFKRQIMALPVIFLIAAIFTGNYLKLYYGDLGVRQDKADHAYRVLIYQNEDYNWYDIYDKESFVKTRDLKSSIVLLSDDSMPVMFLSGGMVGEADGTTRMLVYDEVTEDTKAVLGAWHSITIDGYCKADEDHKYPVIYCHGGHMGLINELIYELKDNKPFLIGEAKINELPESNVPDEYSWNGQTVTKEDYNAKRDQILKGYKEIEWRTLL